MESALVFALLALAAGLGVALQAGINAHLGRSLGDPVLAAFVSFAVGAVGLGILVLALRPTLPGTQALAGIPAWAWMGGLLGAFYVATAILVAPRLGAASLVTLVIAGQVLTALVIDHYGWLGFQQQLVTWPRAVGAGLLAAGVALIRFA